MRIYVISAICIYIKCAYTLYVSIYLYTFYIYITLQIQIIYIFYQIGMYSASVHPKSFNLIKDQAPGGGGAAEYFKILETIDQHCLQPSAHVIYGTK